MGSGSGGNGPGRGVRAEGLPRPWIEGLRQWSRELGLSQIGVAGVDLASAEPGLIAWLEAGFHGSMDYMARHGLRRARPAEAPLHRVVEPVHSVGEVVELRGQGV